MTTMRTTCTTQQGRPQVKQAVCSPNGGVTRRRPMVYPTLQAIADDLTVLQKAHETGRLRRLGKHDPGPIFDHLARGMARSFDGFSMVPAWWLRALGPWIKKRVLAKPFKPGFMLPSRIERSVWDDSVSFEEGIRSLLDQVARASAPGANPSQPHPIFGRMTPHEWQAYYLRHAELHLNFLEVDE